MKESQYKLTPDRILTATGRSSTALVGIRISRSNLDRAVQLGAVQWSYHPNSTQDVTMWTIHGQCIGSVGPNGEFLAIHGMDSGGLFKSHYINHHVRWIDELKDYKKPALTEV